MRSWLVLALLAPLSVAIGCSKPGSSAGDAERVYADRCASCHGAQGKGDGPAAAALNPRPRNFGDAAWQAGVNDDHLASVIVKGGAGAGKSPLMPANPDLEPRPEVVRGLVAIVRGFTRK
jgi:mono/diheme cytochrome c family protein